MISTRQKTRSSKKLSQKDTEMQKCTYPAGLEFKKKLSQKDTEMQKCIYPAGSVSKSDMTVGEVSGTPAVNRFSVVLLGRQKNRENDQECRRISNNENIV